MGAKIIDQFEHHGTATEAMKLFAERHFGEPRKVDPKSICRVGHDSKLFRLIDGVRIYCIEYINHVWVITLVEDPTT